MEDYDEISIGFDAEDSYSWYFGLITRQKADELLSSLKVGGMFLVRDSNTNVGDYVLSVWEDNKTAHYIINAIRNEDNKDEYMIGDQVFGSLSDLLLYFNLHYLTTTPLLRPYPRKKAEFVVTLYDFAGNDRDDLPFRRGEKLEILKKVEDQWWIAKNSEEKTGMIPVPYVKILDGISNTADMNFSITSRDADSNCAKHALSRSLPAYARANRDWSPIEGHQEALRFQQGDMILVTKFILPSHWRGTILGRQGCFPSEYADFVEDS